jgi:hypothetical protein
MKPIKPFGIKTWMALLVFIGYINHFSPCPDPKAKTEHDELSVKSFCLRELESSLYEISEM